MKKTKMLKIIAGISGFLAILQLLYPLALKFYIKYMINQDIRNPYTANSIGIIGGSDGPTSIFIARNADTLYFVLKYGFSIICAIISIISIVMIKKRK